MTAQHPPAKQDVCCITNGNGPNECPNEYYGIKLVPAKLLKVDVASHSFEMYFKLYIQQKLEDRQVCELIRGFQGKEMVSESKPLAEALQSFVREVGQAAATARACLGGLNFYDWNSKLKDPQTCKTGLCKTLKKGKCALCKMGVTEKREVIKDVLNTFLTLSDAKKDEPFTQRIDLIRKSNIVFQNNIKPIEFEKEQASFKLNDDPRSPGSTFFAYQVHLNGRGVFSMSTQDNTDNNPKYGGYSWRMRQYPFDFYECCIDLHLSRHSSYSPYPYIPTVCSYCFDIDIRYSVDKICQRLDCGGELSKPKTFFAKYNPEWMPEKGIPLNFELVANEWAVWQAAECAPSESVYLDEEDKKTVHYQVSFGTITAKAPFTKYISTLSLLLPLLPARYFSQKHISRL
jgi:hypothetical protein